MPDAVPDRFTSAVFVAEERLDAGFDAVQAGLADLLYRGALITSSVDCRGQGMTGSVRLGPAMPVAGPDSIAGLRCKLGVAEAEVIKSRGTKGKARVTFTVDPQVGAQAAAVCGEWNGWSADAGVMQRDAEGDSA